jgi:hypothetical protein
VTGDGANDAAAIRLADVGVALGPRSTPAAREAADLVITSDEIEALIDAVVEARAMWSSVRDALGVLLGGNLGEIGFTIGAGLLNSQSPLNARQLLLVNLLTDVLPSTAIATRPPLNVRPETLLHEGPDASLASPLTKAIFVRAGITAGAAMVAWSVGRFTGHRAPGQHDGTARPGRCSARPERTGGAAKHNGSDGVGGVRRRAGRDRRDALAQSAVRMPTDRARWLAHRRRHRRRRGDRRRRCPRCGRPRLRPSGNSTHGGVHGRFTRRSPGAHLASLSSKTPAQTIRRVEGVLLGLLTSAALIVAELVAVQLLRSLLHDNELAA